MKLPFAFDRDTRRRWKDLVMAAAALACVILALLPLGSILFTAIVQGIAAIRPSLFLTDSGYGGIGNAIQGTLILLGLSSAVSLPVGILAGIYVAEFGNNRIGRAVRFFTDVMTQIPSIVMGVFAFSLIFELGVSGLVSPRLVYSTISGTIALSVIMIPFVARTTDEALRLVPVSTREAALALGIPKYRVTLSVVLSSASSGLITGVLLAVARAGGETAPLLVTALGNLYGFSGLDQPIESMTHTIYMFALAPQPSLHQAAWGASLILTLMMLLISILSRVVFRRRFGTRGAGA
jgi:phosphate transport system permease protein